MNSAQGFGIVKCSPVLYVPMAILRMLRDGMVTLIDVISLLHYMRFITTLRNGLILKIEDEPIPECSNESQSSFSQSI